MENPLEKTRSEMYTPQYATALVHTETAEREAVHLLDFRTIYKDSRQFFNFPLPF